MNLTDKEIEKLRATKSELEWDIICDEIKCLRNEDYPVDWFLRVIASGLMAKIKSSWQN